MRDHYKSECFVVVSKYKDTNVYTIHLMCGKGKMHVINWQPLFSLKRFQYGSDPVGQSCDTNYPLTCPRRDCTK